MDCPEHRLNRRTNTTPGKDDGNPETKPTNDTDVSTQIIGMMGDKGKRIIETIGLVELLLNTD